MTVISYVPGWDCHGLPIELKVLETEKKTREDMDAVSLRQKARLFAEQNVEQQLQSFRSWGIMADWSFPYKTMSKIYY
jgi:isoleucyl-tRNA synthetase